MKYLWIYIAFLVAFCLGCKYSQTENKSKVITNDHKALVFDTTKKEVDTVALNQTDSAFVVYNKLVKDDIGDKRKEYITDIYFTDKTLPKLSYPQSIGVAIYLLGDLDGDYLPELLLQPSWFSSCWASVNLFSLKKDKWVLVKKGSMYFCSDQIPTR